MRSLAVWALASLAIPAAAAAEQPDWDLTADRLLAVIYHANRNPEHFGLWSFDPDSGQWERLRHYSFNAQTWDWAHGRGCFLSAADGIVMVQTWPANLELEAGTYRLLRRSSPVSEPTTFGWAVEGPLVGAADAAQLGLEPGTHGIARCLAEVCAVYGNTPVCPPYSVPGTAQSVECTETAPWPLLRRDDTGGLELAGLLPPLDWVPQWPELTEAVPTLSLDPERRAFWRGTPRGVELVPIIDGTVGPPSQSHAFDFSPFDDPAVMLDVLYYHPRRHRLFLVTRTDYRFLALSDDLEPEASYTGGTPVALTSLGEQPATLEQLLPAVAHTPGRNDTFWTSDLWLYNPSAEATTVTLRRVAAPDVTRAVDLPPHASVSIPDALTYLGGGPTGDGSTHDGVVLTAPYCWGEQVVATSRCSTAAPGGGTFGHAVTAAPGRAGYSNHLVYPGEPEPEWTYPVAFRVPYGGPSTLYADRGVPGRMRHNLGVVNDFDDPVTLTLLWGHLESGERFYPDDMATRPASALQTVEVAPHSVRVVQLDTLFPPEVVEVWPPRIALWGSRPVAIWFSMVDNLTGDATFVPYSAVQWGNDLEETGSYEVRAVVPVVVHAAGAGGTAWRTDLYGADQHLTLYSPRAWLHPSEPASDCGGAAASGEIRRIILGEVQPPGFWNTTYGPWATVYRDVARAFEPCYDEEDLHAGLGLMSATWQIGWSRTYTTRDDGGTYGEMLPFYPEGGWPVQHFAGVEVGSTFRVNVGLFNGDGEHAITHRITLYSSDGQIAAERTITLQPYASLQRRLEHLFRMEVGTLPAGTYGMTVLPLDDPANGVKGRSWAWVSLVDNVTNDPTNWW